MDNAIKLQLRRRRYYLHRRCKPLVRLIVKQRTVEVAPGELDRLTEKQRAYISELKTKFDYAIQLVIV